MSQIRNAFLILAVHFAAVFGPLNSVRCDDWPQWRGANRDGLWKEQGIRDDLPNGQLPLSWSVEIGPGYCGPTVAAGRVYVMDRNADDRNQTERVLCFDSSTGKELWKHAYDAPYKVQYPAGPRASVTIHEGLAYAVGSMGHFHCLNAVSGEVVWKRDLLTEYDINMPIWGIAASPLIYKDLVIQQVGGANACMVAFNKNDGKEVWRALSDRAGYSSPIIIQQAKQDVLVCWTGDSLTGLNPTNGKTIWSHEFRPSRMPIGISTPILADEMLFVSSFYDGSMMVSVPSQSLSSEMIWRAKGPDEKNTQSLHTMIGTNIFEKGYVYGADSYGEFRCLDAKTGARVWEDLTAVPKNRWAAIHMVRQADRVWMFNERGELLIGKLAPTGLTILDRCNLIEPTTLQLPSRGGVCWTHPAFAEKSIFVRNDNKLVKASLAK
ncbi:MAG: PQQ-binding-like beta-propeller repeat protein [Pirellula sp.]